MRAWRDGGRSRAAVALAASLCVLPSCRKAPLIDLGATFVLADASWFADEETLFLFYEVTAEQGLGEPSVVEVSYTTDHEELPWTVLSELPTVHPHVDVDCGARSLCGSASLRVATEPRDVRLRLRYHRDGEMAVEPRTTFNVVDSGPPHTHRSLVVYGVFDEANARVQWRSRHRFPTLRNQRATALGLRRHFVVREPRFGNGVPSPPANPYAYGVPCPQSFVAAGLGEVHTQARAVFHPDPLPLGASGSPGICADATVTDATGTFTATAWARKNPEVRPAFPLLRSPVRNARAVPFFLGPCDRTISEKHEAMQRQRLQLGNLPTTCTDDWQQPGFVDGLVATFRDAVEAERPTGRDMVLVVAVHQDDAGISEAVEDALAAVVPDERHRGTPRLAGAFVLDSTIRGLSLPELEPVTLWCPSTLPLGNEPPDASQRSCAVAPDNPQLDLGPFSFGMLPILPSRDQYLDFIDEYSVPQAGLVEGLAYRVPEFTPTTEHVDLGDFGVVTFLNHEAISADGDDAFSWCVGEDTPPVVFRSPFLREAAGAEGCDAPGVPEEACAGVLPLDWLPDWHDAVGEGTYELGVFWEFPFLLRMDYRLVQAGSVSAFGLSVPFGIASSAESYYGSATWLQEELSLEDELLQCVRFCDHPTFDSAGVYHVTDPFRTTYAHTCYRPAYPAPGDSGFPRDP